MRVGTKWLDQGPNNSEDRNHRYCFEFFNLIESVEILEDMDAVILSSIRHTQGVYTKILAKC